MSDGLGETDLFQRGADESGQSCETALENRASAPRDAHIARFENLEQGQRGLGQVSQFVRQEPESFAPARHLAIEGGLGSSAPVLRDRAGNRVVQAQVQRTNSSVLIGAFDSTASSVMAWQISP